MIDRHSDPLDTLLGPPDGRTLEQRARESTREFVRSLDQIAEASPWAAGPRLTAGQVLDAYGADVLREIASEGAALLSAGPRAAGLVVRERRELLGLDVRHVANAAKVPASTVEALERFDRVPIRRAEQVARAVGLDERLLSWKAEPSIDDQQVAVRLRTVGKEHAHLTAAAVVGLAEAAWVAGTQIRLQRALGITPTAHGIVHSDIYGSPGYPAHEHADYLAADAREKLQLGPGRLERSLREICEDLLAIPVVQAELGGGIAGATVQVGDGRAIVINLDGGNRHVFMRRATIAHELGHLLYDPPRQLNALCVDDYDSMERAPYEETDRVEQRANAFGVSFIAPKGSVVDFYRSATGDKVWSVMNHFGISFTAARYQIWNGLKRSVSLQDLQVSPTHRRPDQAWEALEEYTVGYHPIRGVRPSRAGKFSGVVVRAALEGVVSWDSAAEMLETEPARVREALDAIKVLFPGAFK